MLSSAKAIDGYIFGAKVCLDINSNNTCDSNEPYTTTANDGSYSLSVNVEKGIYLEIKSFFDITDFGFAESYVSTDTKGVTIA